MNRIANWELSGDQAENYERYFVPAIFAQWATQVAAIAKIDLGNSVLDVGCGTGILARIADEEAGQHGKVTGLDRAESMLAVAREKAPQIEWRQGQAEDLPFHDASFDRVVSQFALMFIKNKVTALREMWRVLKPGGRLTIAVWAPIEHSAGYSQLLNITREFAGPKAGSALARPWSLGNEIKLRSLLRSAGIENFMIDTRKGTAKYPSIETLLEVEIKGTPVAEFVNDHRYDTVLAVARRRLEQFRVSTGEIVLHLEARIISADKR